MGNISITQLLIIAAIVVLLFGTKKLRSLGTDLGSALKGFKKAMKEDEDDKNSHHTIDGSVEKTVATPSILEEKKDKD